MRSEVEVRVSARARAIRLRVDSRTGRVLLTVPRRVSRRRALEWAAEQSEWVEAQLALVPSPERLGPGSVVPLFDSRARANTIFPYDVSADGQRFLINMSLEDKSPSAMSITLLVNWMAALANN